MENRVINLYSALVYSSCSAIYFVTTRFSFSYIITLDSPHHFQISFSSFSEFSTGIWCYLSIISGEKLIFFYEIHREFYCVGKSSCRYYKSLSTIMYVFVREEFSFNRLYYSCFGIFLNECYVSSLGLY